jgi:hypothetical protein
MSPYLCSLAYVTFGHARTSGPRQNYGRWRRRQIACGRWEPWAPAAPVREHVQALQRGGASLRAIGRASGVSPTTVQRLLHGEPSRCRAIPHRIHVREAQCLLAVTSAAAEQAATRRDAAGSRLRLRALTAIGYPSVSLAAQLGIAPSTVRELARGHARTISPELHRAVAALYDELWDQPPVQQTGAQRRAVAAARARAARNGWPAPMGLDDDQIDEPGYRPRALWRPTAAACAAPRHAAGHGRSSQRAGAQVHAGQGRGR